MLNLSLLCKTILEAKKNDIKNAACNAAKDSMKNIASKVTVKITISWLWYHKQPDNGWNLAEMWLLIYE